MNSSSKTITGNGLITHFNVSDESINELSKRVPIIGESYRSVRHVFTNDVNNYAPKELFRKIVKEINIHLHVIVISTMSLNQVNMVIGWLPQDLLGAKHGVPVMSIAIPHKNARAISQH
eukprot:scaffold19330_cov151-Skeletonema_dohrnii-CCMP3373.AAC.1